VKSAGLAYDVVSTTLSGTYDGTLTINSANGGDMTQAHVDAGVQAHLAQQGVNRVLHTLTAGKDFTGLGSPLSLQATSIHSLLFPEDNKMTKIGQYALSIDKSMSDIKLPKWVTELNAWSTTK
jgi:hypothetical protein